MYHSYEGSENVIVAIDDQKDSLPPGWDCLCPSCPSCGKTYGFHGIEIRIEKNFLLIASFHDALDIHERRYTSRSVQSRHISFMVLDTEANA
jgi:hypothetical protein